MQNLIPRLDFLAQSLFKKQEFCPHCKSQDIKKVDSKYFAIAIEQCCSCDLYFTSPIYKPTLTSKLYNSLYEAEGSTTKLPNSDELSVLKASNFKDTDKYFGDRLQAIKSLDSGKKLLEIGSSWGYFLYQAQQSGFEVTGLEIGEPRRLFGIQNLGQDIVGSIDELKNRTFDIVYTAHTLEHFTDLSTIFKDIYALLSNKGLLLIEVPNFDYEEFGKRSLSVIGGVHPLGFSSNFFQKNLPNYGFRVLGFYNSWDCFPDKPIDKSQHDVVILMAEKVSSPDQII
jgi:SAM-dependent methyltransferase